jgi:heat-inducible transcriptional repressor
MLTARQLLIFKYIVEEFIATGEPVGSKLLMTKYQLPYSSATIRNEMNFLEKQHYLDKTHTSSGRVPSKKGYHFYVETLLQPDVDETVKNQVSTLFADTNRSLNEIIQQCCEMLSQLTHLTTVALGPNSSYERFQNVTLIPLGRKSATAIIVTDKGHVENRTFPVRDENMMDDLSACVDVINETLRGVPINNVIEKLENDVKPILNVKVKEHEVLFNAFLEAFMKFAKNNIYFSGKDNMLYQPEYNDVNKLRKLVTAFENSQTWNLLEPLTQEEGVTIRIGNETPFDDLNDVSVISASFDTGSRSKGSISVIGPTRMPYEKVVSRVEYISKNIESLILDEQRKNDER